MLLNKVEWINSFAKTVLFYFSFCDSNMTSALMRFGVILGIGAQAEGFSLLRFKTYLFFSPLFCSIWLISGS